MTASADKVQYLLENSLQQSIGLVRKGIFTQQQLQVIMLRRQKCEHAMLKKQYKMTDYLGSIEYQYELERERRKRMSQIAKLEEGSNPLFRKQSSADYVIVKRIIRLWDRTMHKYKFKLSLWKQYLSFTIAINSKKHFYKTLTNSLKFLPFEIDLWKIGATYEIQYGMNMWKGRKILIKGLKMVPEGQNNLALTQFMLQYELKFLKMLLQRKKILIKGQEPLKIIGEDDVNLSQQSQQNPQTIETMNLEKYDDLMWLIVQEAINKNTKLNSKQFSFNFIKARFMVFFNKKIADQDNQEVKTVVDRLKEKLRNFQPSQQQVSAKQLNIFKVEETEAYKSNLKNVIDVNQWKQKIIQGTNINWLEAQAALKSFCLKPRQTSDLLNFLLRVNSTATIKFLSIKKANQKLPATTIISLIDLYLHERSDELVKIIKIQVDRWISLSDLRISNQLFEKISQFNAKEGRLESTTRMLRSLSIAYGNDQDYLHQYDKFCKIS